MQAITAAKVSRTLLIAELVFASVLGICAASAQAPPETKNGAGNAQIGHDNKGQICTSGAHCIFENAAPAKTAAAPAPEEGVIYIDCAMTMNTIHAGPDGVAYVLELQNDVRYSGLSEMFVVGPNGDMNIGVMEIYRCAITSYLQQALFRLSIPLRYLVWEAVPADPTNPTSKQSGALVTDEVGQISVPKIDAGRENPFVFYIFSESKRFIEVDLPNQIAGQFGNDAKPRPIRVILGYMPALHLSPRMESK